MNQLTVNQAIKKGHQMVNYPVFAIMIIGFGITIYFSILKLNSLVIGTFGVSTFVFMWLWWSIQITRWKILAFGNVRNVHELKRKAIEQQLIWNDDSWFNKTEIWSDAQKQEWQNIEKKFQNEDGIESIHDDGIVPQETIVKISGTLKWLYGVMVIGCLILASIEIKDDEIFSALLLSVVAIFCGLLLLPKVLDTTPQLVLSNEGIKTKEANIVSWSQVKKANVVLQGRGRGVKWFLDLEYHSKNSNGKKGRYIEISNFNPSPGKIEQLIKIYRQREKNRNN